MKSLLSDTSETPGDRPRDRVKQSVADLAHQIDAGLVLPDRLELVTLAEVCAGHHLHAEATRIRRWLGIVR